MALSEGATLLAQALRARGHSQADACRELNVDSGYLSRLVGGERTPSMKLSARIEELYAVPIAAWLRPASNPTAAA